MIWSLGLTLVIAGPLKLLVELKNGNMILIGDLFIHLVLKKS